jgi:large subunit ribosomal protein L9
MPVVFIFKQVTRWFALVAVVVYNSAPTGQLEQSTVFLLYYYYLRYDAENCTLHRKRGKQTMKVLLLEDVDNLGLAGRVVTVADGYARNYLIPRELARAASKGALKQTEQIRKAGERKRARLTADAQALAQRIEGLTLTFQARAGEKGKLYGSITTADLAEAVERELGQELDRRKIISDPLRQLGDHAVQIRLMHDVSATLNVIIEPEGGEVAEAPEGEVAPPEAEAAVAATDEFPQAETESEEANE